MPPMSGSQFPDAQLPGPQKSPWEHRDRPTLSWACPLWRRSGSKDIKHCIPSTTTSRCRIAVACMIAPHGAVVLLFSLAPHQHSLPFSRPKTPKPWPEHVD
ncbi:hypothetical protein N657DRAFT_193195 [Parathielavia appendiculata]|uniref:Uncharacterized protein n=1 Tax=Parathielavia appendiculata TaxID=2587402 RepID=A0AAN6U615_9PEZI|nr:hypothetical protein N657DRAFT_193195 [Parathielavia appendiculata]